MRRYSPSRNWWRSSRSRRVRGSLRGCSAILLYLPWAPRPGQLSPGGSDAFGMVPSNAGLSPRVQAQPQQPRFRRPPRGQEGRPCQGQGEGLEAILRGFPGVLKGQLLQMTLRAELWSRQAGSLHAGAAEPLPISPEGKMSLQRQEELETMCEHLRRQVGEMERFLGDYGLQWVGEPSDREDSEDLTSSEDDRAWMTAKKFWKPADSLVPPEVDFDRLLASLQDLSELAVGSDTQVTPMPGGAQLHDLEPIPLKLYRNGMMIFDGPFRSFHDPSTQSCLRDILDGFFPAELQRLYPNGVPFKVSDLRHQVYQEDGLDPFPGEGRVTGMQRIRKPSVMVEHPGSRMTPEKFLNKLPKFVIRQGEVIDIRGPIRDALQNCCPRPLPVQEIMVETPALAAERKRIQESPESPEHPVSMLRIKSENGEQAFLLMMWPEDTVGDVRALLAQARGMDPNAFEIFSAFPPTVYREDELTLQAAGLVPNAALLMRASRALTPAPGPQPSPQPK
ncbi:UBX domain-containing protein 11 isoform X2 [Myotis myotis]|uniref:UBX domain-containing protein 11 isoform X2 n=1 Tax=Myotis myotis TaxID=51298 RepID=UPI00174CA5CE|nr:UBX domain-containing protein 11 isoform X2 [Myotis myotis]